MCNKVYLKNEFIELAMTFYPAAFEGQNNK